MGQEISKLDFEREDFEQFQQRLRSEMELLRCWFSERKFADDSFQCGLELEGWLVEQNGEPAPDNSLFLATLDRKSVVPELSKFNFELNVSPQYVASDGIMNMQRELQATWARCAEVASRLNHRIVSIGILPTLVDSMLCLKNMSSMQRYAALNAQVLRLRGDRPLLLEIDGTDHLKSSHHDLMLESAATSFQVHLKVPQAVSVRYYNASLIASSFTVALAANAPLLFGKQLWDDTRIPVFEQAVDTAGPAPRVTFGNKYLEHSLLELFEDNLANHRVLLPTVLEEPTSKLPHVRMHNGTLWNWNRGLIGFEGDGQPHIRIEHRPMSGSPSIDDLFADMLFYLGVTQALATETTAPENCLPFESAKQNFYAAAKSGLSAEIQWLDGKFYRVSDLLSTRMLANALDGLADLQVAEESIRHCQETLSGRISTLQNGASWQRKQFTQLKGDLPELLLRYCDLQKSGKPVHCW